MTPTPADPPLPHDQQLDELGKLIDGGDKSHHLGVQRLLRYADQLHALLESERSEHAKTRARAEAAESNYRFVVERAADEKLDGYRELGARAAAAETERDALAAKLEAIAGPLIRHHTGFCVFCPFGIVAYTNDIEMRCNHDADCPLVAQGFIDRDGRRLEAAGKGGA